MKIGIAISTFSEKGTDKERYSIIEKSLESLNNITKLNNIYELYIIIVIDGEIPELHNEVKIFGKYITPFSLTADPARCAFFHIKPCGKTTASAMNNNCQKLHTRLSISKQFQTFQTCVFFYKRS